MSHDQSEQAASQPDNSYASRIWQYKQAETVAAMIFVGRELGLYKHLAGAGPVTAADLSALTDLHERWLLEWLRLQTAAKILNYVDETHFELPDIGSHMLADEDSDKFMLDNFEGGIGKQELTNLLESFRTGIGRTYEEAGPEGARRSEARHTRSARSQVVPRMIPALDGAHEKLESGCLVADVGCGDGALVMALAERYPSSHFRASEPNIHAVEHVRALVAAAGIKNIEVLQQSGEDLEPSPSLYDLVITFDCIHDMTHPERVVRRIKECLKPDGTWFIKDIRSKPSLKENLRNPMLAMMYGFSLLACMSSAMSEPDGAGLGTLGFNPQVAERMARDAGFTRFVMHDFKDPGNLYYEVRP